MRHLSGLVLFISVLAAVYQPAEAHKRVIEPPTKTIAPPHGATDNPVLAEQSRAGLNLMSTAAGETTWLHSATFNPGGSTCSAQGWTSADLTSQSDFWHVDDYAGLPFGPVEGTKSLWCGARAATDYVFCTYQTLPGYGNAWNQSWCTKTCFTVAGGATTNLDVAFAIRLDSEPSYDAVALEYTNDCSGNTGWYEIDGGNPYWTGESQFTVNSSYVVNAGPVKVRLRFTSDGAWSDQDGLFSTDGAVHIDGLKVEGLALELFEDEPVGATSSNDWESCNTSYGDRAILLKGSELLQEDPCKTNLTCMWAFIKDSVANYACAGHPEQIVVPYKNVRAQYIDNEIWSPFIPLTGSGSDLNLQFDVYRDLKLDADIFYQWHVRTLVNGCPTNWTDRNFVFYSDDKRWFTHLEPIGAVVNLASATHVQVAISVIDMCPFWCSVFSTGQCHSHAPLVDNVKVYRVNTTGPQWSVRDIDFYQDAFSTNGTITGTARVNTAVDIKPSSSPNFTPGDSATVNFLVDPTYAVGAGTNVSGLLDDPNISTFIGRHKTKKQVYMWVAVWPQGQPGKSGAALSEGPGGQANRYPYIPAKNYVDGNGVTWTAIRADYTYTGTPTNPGDGGTTPYADPFIAKRFNVDLNDNLFVPGDTICYFFGASSPGGTSYYSDQWHVTPNIAEVAANPMEVTILPAGGFNRGGAILYVDGADGLGNQPYFEGAFLALGSEDLIDRYDVRAPSSSEANRLAARVDNVVNQLNAAYLNGIIWDCGSLPITLGDGTGDPLKTDDYELLNTYLANLSGAGGVYLCGDDVAQNLAASTSPSAMTFKTSYMPFNLASGNHQTSGVGLSPAIVFWPGRMFNDSFIAFGGCPALNDFDVMNATGTSRVEMSYGTSQSASGAVVSNFNGNAHVLLSGFSFASIRDDEVNGISDRAEHLSRIIAYVFATDSPPPTGADRAPNNQLSQNYPNPFNPTTTIAYSIKTRGHVQLNVYDVGGRLVRTLANEVRPAGPYQVTWDGRDGSGTAVASGVYFYRLVAGDFTQTRKMVLLK